MKYSLRSLFFVITLVAVVLGGRIEYLRRWSAYHKREHKIWVQKAVNTPTGPYDLGLEPMLPKGNYHLQKESEYNQAIFKPWTIIEENPPLDTSP
jgi:hypothetical protein